MYAPDASVATNVLERELEFVMLETPAHLRADALAVAVRAAKQAGASAVRLAALTGLSRQAIYDALKRRPASLPEDMSYVIAASIASQPQTPESLAGLLAVPLSELLPVVNELERGGLLKSALANDNTRVLLRGDRALDALRARLDDRRWVRLERFSIYVRLGDGESQNIAEAAAAEIGGDRFTILAKGIAHHVVTDELAFGVAADDRRDAIAKAEELWARIRRRAGMPRTVLPLANVIDPVRRAT